ncbi:hypothetical protein CRG98_030487 [Punica granatum]|uniref:Uncharacterized protein n=1 Tax=Punica granatum TaxID=22663 RepID=A0A2I0IYS3_PUNGR|nr:hypothetical protein CRG98_030487 [Punica granatum]
MDGMLKIPFGIGGGGCDGPVGHPPLDLPSDPDQGVEAASASIRDLGVRVGFADWWLQPQIDRGLRAPISNRPRTSDSESPVDSGLGPLVRDLDPSTEVVGVLRGYRRPWWRGRGR